MPDGHSDTAIDFYASAFCREILDAARPVRFSEERITYGSDIFDGFHGKIWPANTNDEIAENRRLVGGRRVPLARLADGSRTYGRIIHNMLRPFGRRQWKDHFLTTYPDDRSVAFTVFDFDRHPPKGPYGNTDGLAGALSVSAYIEPEGGDPMVGLRKLKHKRRRQSWQSVRGATSKGVGRSSGRGRTRMKAHRVGTYSPGG